MRKIVLTIAIAITALTLLAACKPAGLTEFDNGRTIEISKGASFTIALQSNPSTGYAWTVAAVDSAILQQQGDKVYEQGNTDPNIVGAGGTETLTFKGLTSGQTTLRLVYSRVWETDVLPIETFEITIVVK
jgi:inhibitor of cysteine peptidase